MPPSKDVILHDKQKEVAADPHRFRVLNWGRKSGKTELAIEEIIGYAIVPSPFHNKPPKISYIGETRKEAKRIAWDRAKLRTKPIWYKDPNESNLELYIKVQKKDEYSPEYSTVFFDGWENVNALIGEEFDFLVLDEVSRFRNFWAGWLNTLRPTLTPRRGHAMFISRPMGLNHWYDLNNIQATNANFKSFQCTAYDNPFVAKEEIDEARNDLAEDKFAQEYLAEFRKMEGLVYKEFDRGRHLFDDQTPRRGDIVEVIAGVDFGYTNPSAIVKIEHDTNNEYWITEEWYKTQKTNSELIEVAKTMGINNFYPDPAEPDRIEEMRRAGLNVRDVSKDIEKGIDSIHTLLKSGRLHIHVRCLNLISELETYHYPEKKPDKNDPELPVKEKDHGLDAMRYALHMNAPVEIQVVDEDFGLYAARYD